MNIENLLSQKINMPQIKSLADWASGNQTNRELLWDYSRSADRRTSINALWVISHLPETDSVWIARLRDNMIDTLLDETVVAKKRLMLQILRNLDYGIDDIRSDFLNYCLSKINSEYEPYAIRCYCIYLAFKMCRHFPELIAELEENLDLMALQPLSPGLKSALQQTRLNIKRISNDGRNKNRRN